METSIFYKYGIVNIFETKHVVLNVKRFVLKTKLLDEMTIFFILIDIYIISVTFSFPLTNKMHCNSP